MQGGAGLDGGIAGDLTVQVEILPDFLISLELVGFCAHADELSFCDAGFCLRSGQGCSWALRVPQSGYGLRQEFC